MRTRLLSLVRAMRRKEIASSLNPLFSPSFEFEFATRAVRSDSCAKDLDAIVRALPEMLNEPAGRDQAEIAAR